MKKKLLLVEDEVILAMVKKQELARYNYETAHVTTGEKAVDLVCSQNEPIDLILMDIDLGRGIDGTEAARQILEHKEIPIVFLSSHEDREIVEKTEKITSYGYVVKSSSITVLDASIKMAFKLFDSQFSLEKELQERRILEKKMSADEKRTKTWLQESPICTKIVGTDFNLQFMSDAGFEMLELDKSDEEYGKPYPFHFFPDDFHEMMTRNLKEAKKSKEITYNSGRTNTVNGDEVYLQSTIVPILDEDQEIEYFIVFSIDATEQMRSRKELEKTELLARIGGWSINLDSRDAYLSKGASEIYEIEPDKVLPVEEGIKYYAPEHQPVIKDAVEKCINTGKPYELELKLITEKGNKRWVRTGGYAEIENDTIKRVSGYIKDITDNKESLKRLEENQTLIKSILQILPGSLNVVDRDLRLLMSNKEQYLLNQPNNTDNIGTRCYQIFQKQSKPCPWCHVLDSIQNDSVFEEITDEEDPRTKITGRYWHIYTIPFKNADGENVGAIEYAHDITELKRVEQQLRESEDRLREAQRIAHIGNWSMDLQTGKVEMSDELLNIIGVKDENEASHLSKQEKLYTPESWQRLTDSLDTVSSTGESVEMELEFSDKNTKYRYALSTAIPVFDDKHNIIALKGTLQDITDRKIAEEERRKSDQRFRIAQDMSPDGFTIFKPVRNEQNRIIDFTWVYQNAAVARMNGTDPQKVVGRSFLELFPGVKNTQFMKVYKQVAESGKPMTFEDVYVGETMKTKSWFHITVVSMGEDIAILAHDITERKNVEQTLKESELNFKSIIENSTNVFYKHDTNHKLTYLSPQIKDLLGYKEEEAKGLWTEFATDNPINEIGYCKTVKAIETGKRQGMFELEAQHKDGYPIWVEVREAPIVKNKKTIEIVGTLTDISERKKAELSFKESERRLSLIVNESPFPVAMTDIDDTEVLFWSNSASKLTGYSPRNVSEWYELAYPDEEYRAQVSEQWKRFLEEARKSDKAINTGEYNITCADGSKKICELFIQFIPGSIVITLNDITDQKQAAEELREALIDKDFLMKELNHRVKNNLLMVSSLISLKDSETGSNLSDIKHQVEAISLIHEKLYQSESIVEINSKDYFGDLLDSIFSTFTKRGVRIDKSIEDVTLPTETTMTLGLIINEIATNAIKHGFTDREDAVFSMTMEKDKKNNQLKIILSNSGKPFPEDVDIESTNTLGLRLINALVAQLDGTVKLQRKPNPEFTIRFPKEETT